MEYLYQYLWRYGLFGKRLPLTCGGEVEVLHPGTLNRDSGPDFFNSRLDFGQGRWAGNVEVHTRASDWYRHGHDNDPAYDSVLLHVVGTADRQVTTAGGRPLPTVRVDVPEGVHATYRELWSDRVGVRCRGSLDAISPLAKTDWVESLAIERVQEKSRRIQEALCHSGGDWRKVSFVTLARGLGFRLNSLPMGMLAMSLQSNCLDRHADNLLQIEAMLFGQAGMLEAPSEEGDAYYESLRREYNFLRAKYGLRPIDPSLWKYSSTRPYNFPERRIAFLAKGFYDDRASLLDSLRDCGEGIEEVTELFGWQLEGYWSRCVNFGSRPSARKVPVRLGKANRQLLVINVAVPLLYTYGALTADDRLSDRALGWLEQLPAEKNTRMDHWKSAGLEADDAMRSQALLHLRDRYCDRGRCDECRFAYALINGKLKKES